MKLNRSIILTALALSAAVACSSSTKPSTETVGKSSQALSSGCTSGGQCTLVIAVPQGLTPEDVVLTGSTTLSVGNGVTVTTGSGGFGTVANLGSGATNVGVQASVGVQTIIGNLLSQGPIALSNNAAVRGSITAGSTITEQQGAVVTGAIIHQSVATDASRQVQVTFPASAPSITLQPGGSQTIAPGAYGNVTVNSRASLSLSTGTYLFNSLDTEPQSSLNLNEAAGPVLIYVRNTLLYKGSEVQTGGDGNVFVGFFGTQAVSLQAPFRGTLVAPNAEVELTTQTAGFAGAFFASNIQVDPNSTITGIGAVLPGVSAPGLSPTLNCVTQLSPGELGAIFGYVNATGSNITLGVGPHNLVMPSPADRGQPILFVPGTVPVAALIPFASGTHVSLTLGQQSVIASSSSPACSAALTAGIAQLTGPGDPPALAASIVGLLSNPNTPALLGAVRNQLGAQLTPFQSSLFDAGGILLNNVDLLTTPSTSMSASQIARVPAFVQAVQSNPAVLALRMAGDAQRGSLSTTQCDVAEATSGRSIVKLAPPPTDSFLGQTVTFSQSTAYKNAAAAFGAVATNAQESSALLALPGFALAGALPASALGGLSVPGPIPTGGSPTQDLDGALDILGGVVAGGAGIVIGLSTCAFTALAGCAVAGLSALTGLNFVIIGIMNLTNACGSSGTPLPTCELGTSISRISCASNQTCIDACCYPVLQAGTEIALTAGTRCGNGAPACSTDAACVPPNGGAGECLNGCCAAVGSVSCGAAKTCAFDTDCSSGDTCQFGCCSGPCGLNGVSCDSHVVPGCGTANVCPGGSSCTNGCCQSCGIFGSCTTQADCGGSNQCVSGCCVLG
jgi:hypothetical protein